MKQILFNTEMVLALLARRKSVTRRVVKPPYYIDDEEVCRISGLAIHQGTRVTDGMPYPDAPYRASDILYVRETWNGDWCDHYIYKADGGSAKMAGYNEEPKWIPSIHMPKEAARLFLRVTDVRVERLRDITEEQAEKEGCSAGRIVITGGPWGVEDDPEVWTAREAFSDLWDSTIKKADRPIYGWAANPWVWVIEFERISKEEALKGSENFGIG